VCSIKIIWFHQPCFGMVGCNEVVRERANNERSIHIEIDLEDGSRATDDSHWLRSLLQEAISGSTRRATLILANNNGAADEDSIAIATTIVTSDGDCYSNSRDPLCYSWYQQDSSVGCCCCCFHCVSHHSAEPQECAAPSCCSCRIFRAASEEQQLRRTSGHRGEIIIS